MTSGLKMRFEGWLRSLLAAIAVLAMSASMADPAMALDLSQLMGMLSQQKNGEATFTEQRFVRGIEGPLESSGTLSFKAPDTLTRRTLTPRPESMAVEGNQVTLSRGNRTRTMSLDSMPEMLGLVEAMRGTLNGNTQSLERYFKSAVSGTPANWKLDLSPLDARLAAQVRGVTITGKQSEVLGIEMEFIGGDRSVMTITPDRARGSAPRPTSPAS
jgi:outer membrane lipoprotein-sorting protein